MNYRFTKISVFFITELIIRGIILPFIIITLLEIPIMYYNNLQIIPSNYYGFNLILSLFIGLFFLFFNLIWGDFQTKIMKNTEKKYVTDFFPYDVPFYTSQYRLFISPQTGKLGIITHLNPRIFQIIDANQIKDCTVDCQKLSSEESKGVRLNLQIGKDTLHFGTFFTTTAFPINSIQVQDGIKKAIFYCDLIENTKKNAIVIK